MSSSSKIVEYDDSLLLAACEFRWSKGDNLALIEAVAICAENDLPHPAWVRNQIDLALAGIYKAVFPNASLQGGQPGLGISSLPEGKELAAMKEHFKTSVKDAGKLLGFTQDRRSIVVTHIKTVRDFHLAELVDRFVDFEPAANPRFTNVTNVKYDLCAALDLTQAEWQKRVSSDLEFGPVNGRTAPIRTIEPICRLATFDVIDDAWDSYKDFLLDQRLTRFEEAHGFPLGK